MAKLLIVDDHLRMVQMIQKCIYEINSSFTPENTFSFFPESDPLELHSLDEFENNHQDNAMRIILTEKKDTVFSKVFQFLNASSTEDVLVLIDVLLNSQNISAPSLERYRADHEYSCELYSELLQIKNGKKIEGYNKIDPDKFFHIIYSRSDAIIGVVTQVLSDLSAAAQTEKEQKYFPRECARPENISWCRNCYDTTNPDFSVAEPQDQNCKPLALPRGYVEFIKKLK